MYTRSADEEERDLAKRLETAAVAAAAEVVTLSRADAGFVAEKLAPPGRSIAPKVGAAERAEQAPSEPGLRCTSGRWRSRLRVLCGTPA